VRRYRRTSALRPANGQDDVVDWDGTAYGQVSALQREMGRRALAGVTFRADERVLDIGCGDGRLTRRIAEQVPDGSVVGIDASPLMIEAAQQSTAGTAEQGRLTFAVADVLTMTFRREFDVAVSFNVLHWVHDQQRAFTRIAAALSAPAWALLQFVCGGDRPSLEDVAMDVAAAPRWREHFRDFVPPYFHAAPESVPAVAAQAGLRVGESRIDDVTWEFPSRNEFLRWATVGFTGWTNRLRTEDLAAAFVEDVVDAYVAVTGSPQRFQFLQLRLHLVTA
jgi:trans-aconitate 2-methyltransferase